MDNAVTDTSGISDGDGHWINDNPEVNGNPAMKNALAKYDSPNAAIVGGYNAMSALGRPHINIPGDDADDTAKSEFKAKLATHMGKPDTAEGYEITRPDGSDETNYNMAAEKAFLELAHQNDMGNESVKSMYDFHLKMMAAAQETDSAADQADIDKSVTDLTAKLGGDEKYREAMELKTRLCNEYFGEETAKLLENQRTENGKQVQGTLFGNDVGFNMGLIKIAEVMMKEGRTLTGSLQTGTQKHGALRYGKMEEREAQNK